MEKTSNIFYSPLRYPGGKNRLAKFIAQLCIDNNINCHYIEPFTGGGSVALYLLLESVVEHITINDYDRSIYAFWYCILYKTDAFCTLIEKTKITIDNWKLAKEIQKQKQSADILELGFSTFFLNRTNHSGIINAGVIGGQKQNGSYKIDCRFNKQHLINKIRLIAKNKQYIKLYKKDAVKLIETIELESKNIQNTFFYFDPPYYMKGACLYMNYYTDEQHKEIAQKIRTIKDASWIVSYDDTSYIHKLYHWSLAKKYQLNHFAYRKKSGNEVLFYSKKINIFDETFNKIKRLEHKK